MGVDYSTAAGEARGQVSSSWDRDSSTYTGHGTPGRSVSAVPERWRRETTTETSLLCVFFPPPSSHRCFPSVFIPWRSLRPWSSRSRSRKPPCCEGTGETEHYRAFGPEGHDSPQPTSSRLGTVFSLGTAKLPAVGGDLGPAFPGPEGGTNGRQLSLSVEMGQLWNGPLQAVTCLCLEAGVGVSVENP